MIKIKPLIESFKRAFGLDDVSPSESWNHLADDYELSKDSQRLINSLTSQSENNEDKNAFIQAVYDYGYDYVPTPDQRDPDMFEKTEMKSVLDVIAQLPDVEHHMSDHDITTDKLRHTYLAGLQKGMDRKNMMGMNPG